jgi:MoaA/NifB/PqqE/SkfB family radical SAM enzyme
MSLTGKIKSYSIFSKNILLSSAGRLNHPYKLTFAITNKCNLRCKTCHIWKKKPVDELSTEEIDKFFRLNNFFNWIDLTGGEIFLRKDLLDITKSIKNNIKNLVLLHYPTNGFLTERIVEFTEEISSLDFNNLVLTVSLDGKKDIHNEIRGNNKAFDRCIETYKELKKNKYVKVYLGCTLSPFNINYFENFFTELKDYIPDLKYSDIHLNIYHYSENLYSNEPMLFDKQKIINLIDDFIMKKGLSFLNPISLLEYTYMKNIKNYLSSDKTPFNCKSGRISCFIEPTGNVYPCTGFNIVLGNLRKNNFDLLKILANEKSTILSKQIRNGKCPQCWTPCEAYQNILSNLFIKEKNNGYN